MADKTTPLYSMDEDRMSQPGGLSNDFWLTAVASAFVSIAIGAVLAYFRKRILVLFRKARSYIFNLPARVRVAIYVRKYSVPPDKYLSQELFLLFKARLGPEDVEKRA